MSLNILVGLDGSDGSFAALSLALAMAKDMGQAAISSVSVDEITRHTGAILPVSDEKEWSGTKYAVTIRRGREMAAKTGVELCPHVVVGHEVLAIAQFITEQGFDLLVIGYQGHSGDGHRMMGGSCFGLLQHVICPVLVVK